MHPKFFKLISILITLIVLHPINIHAKKHEKHMTVIIPSYNNKQWYIKNLSALFNQKYKNYKVIYIDDNSTDGTADLVEEYVRICKQTHRFQLIKNKKNCGALENLYYAVHSCDDDDIIVTYDGDDWFVHNRVLKLINKNYKNKNIWLTHGTFTLYPPGASNWSIPIPESIIKKNAFRTFRCASHLRTFYAWLFKKIKIDDLLWNGDFFPTTWDLAMMFPMLEMAGERHAFINEIIYIYNMDNPISDHNIHREQQLYLDDLIRKMSRYNRLKNRYDSP